MLRGELLSKPVIVAIPNIWRRRPLLPFVINGLPYSLQLPLLAHIDEKLSARIEMILAAQTFKAFAYIDVEFLSINIAHDPNASRVARLIARDQR